MKKYTDNINKAMERANANFTNSNLLALRIAIDKYFWKQLNREAGASPSDVKLKELVEELPKDTSIQMLKYKIEFWKLKHSSIEYDPDKLAIVRLGGDSQ